MAEAVLAKHLGRLQLPYFVQHAPDLMAQAARESWSHGCFLEDLVAGEVKREMARLLKPAIRCVDELGYLPIDKRGADGLFQVISQRYERGSTILTSNRAYNQWLEIFNNDSTLTAALLDRLRHHTETLIIEGPSYRMREQHDA